jgi:hypothetical protein
MSVECGFTVTPRLGVGGGAPVFTVGKVLATMVSRGSAWSRETAAKTKFRMARPARRPPFLQLARVGINRYPVCSAAYGESG